MSQTDFNVPDDFPRTRTEGSVSGAQDKLLLTRYEGRYYAPGCTPPEIYRRWDICEDLAQQFSVKARESKESKRAHMTEEEILEQYCVRVLKTGWGSDDEMKWAIRRAAAILGWPIPKSALPDVV